MAVPVNDLHYAIICGMKGISLVSWLPFDHLRLNALGVELYNEEKDKDQVSDKSLHLGCRD
jgi:hypothetical protein